MVLAIGIVVDDAIVVLGVERIMHEEKLNAREAAVIAMEEVTSPIIAIVLVLISVFVPIAFLGGLTGCIVSLRSRSIAVGISGIVALTLTPALCVMILKRETRSPGAVGFAFNNWFANVHGALPAGGDLDDPARCAHWRCSASWSLSQPRFGASPPSSRARRRPGLLHRVLILPTDPSLQRYRQSGQ